jgi:hypothetical protein
MSARPVKVLAIMGAGRSGSTLFDTVLGALDGFFSTGELRDLWTRGLVEHRRCGCGVGIPDCPVWQQVVERSDGSTPSLGALSPSLVVQWQRGLARTRHTPRLLRLERAGDFDTDTASLVQTMDALYQRIAVVSGSHVIVDSSKRPSDAALLRLLPNVDPYVVHLVRDPRAVAFSWQRDRIEPDAADGDEHMPTRSALLSTGVWIELNLVARLVARRYGSRRSMLVRYEDFVRAPRRIIGTILRMLDEPVEPPVDGAGRVTLRANHTVGGNPRRFDAGMTTIRADDEWRRGLAARDEWLCSVLAAPLNLAFGYPLRRPAAPPEPVTA